MAAISVNFLEKTLVKQNASLKEKIQCYLDYITKRSSIVDLESRISEAESRDLELKKLDEDPAFTERLNGRRF